MILRYPFVMELLLLPLAVIAQTNSISWHKVTGGGGTSQNAGWQLSGNVGPSLGVSAGAAVMGAGYWGPGFALRAPLTLAPPANANSPGPTDVVLVVGSGVTLDFTGQSGSTYQVQRSTNLLTWVTIWTTNAPPAGLFKYDDRFFDSGGITPGSAYYRLGWNAP